MSERWDGPDGQWATFRTSYSWGASRRINKALLSDDVSEMMLVLAQATVTALRAKDDKGGWVEAPGPEAWETIDAKAGEAVAGKCMDIWTAWRTAQDPKGLTETPTALPSPEA